MFTDTEGFGLIGTITHNTPEKLLAIPYTGQMDKGVKDYSNKEVMVGAVKIYTLSEDEGKTTLDI